MRTADPATSEQVELANELLALAHAVALEAGQLLLDGWATVSADVSTKSTKTDVVTAMDVASEKLITSRLLAARPDDGLLGEEGSDTPGTSGVRWVIDPLDGTVNYLYGLPAWAVSIGAELNGEVVAGVVHSPVLAKTYTGVLGGKALRNGTEIHASTEQDAALALFATGFAYDAERRLAHGALLARILGSIRDLRRMGSAALDLCAVADGTVDGYFERGPADWDIAAGGFIAQLAGAELARSGDATACANPTIMAWLHENGVHPPVA